MNDIYEIQKIIFGFIYSRGYFILIFIGVFFLSYYFLMIYFLPHFQKKNIINNDDFQKKINYLDIQKYTLSREEFYEKSFLLFQIILYKKYKDKNIFYKTLQELKKNISNQIFQDIQKVYYLRYDNTQIDSKDIRDEILKKIKDVS